jgi:hypothetical protein
MINKPKLTVFVIATLMLFINIYQFGMNDNWEGITFVIFMYLILILVGLYDIGKDN